MTTFEDAKVGDRVWCVYHGWQTIIGLTNSYDGYPIETDYTWYTHDGRISKSKSRTLFWDEVVITPPEKPLPKLEIDTKVLVWRRLSDVPERRYFSHFNKEGKIVTFSSGRTSWSCQNHKQFEWNYWKLAKD